MQCYSDKYYQKYIVSQYPESSYELYLNRLSSIFNRSFTGFKSDCILSGFDIFLIDKTSNELVFFIEPGKLLAGDIVNELVQPVILIYTGNLIGINDSLIIIAYNNVSQYQFKIEANLLSEIQSIPPGACILGVFRITPLTDIVYYIYTYIFNNNYRQLISDLYNKWTISYSLNLNNLVAIGFDPSDKIVILNESYPIRPSIALHPILETEFNNQLTLLTETNPTINRLPITDIENYNIGKSRRCHLSATFREFSDDFYS